MTQSDQEEPFFITPEIEAGMNAAGHVLELAAVRLAQVLEGKHAGLCRPARLRRRKCGAPRPSLPL